MNAPAAQPINPQTQQAYDWLNKAQLTCREIGDELARYRGEGGDFGMGIAVARYLSGPACPMTREDKALVDVRKVAELLGAPPGKFQAMVLGRRMAPAQRDGSI